MYMSRGRKAEKMRQEEEERRDITRHGNFSTQTKPFGKGIYGVMYRSPEAAWHRSVVTTAPNRHPPTWETEDEAAAEAKEYHEGTKEAWVLGHYRPAAAEKPKYYRVDSGRPIGESTETPFTGEYEND